MHHSEQINELAAALSKAQGQMTGAMKDSENPFFKSKYADLESVWDACRKPLADNGLSVVQTVSASEGTVSVTTMLMHSSGQCIQDTLRLNPKDPTPQSLGSCISYGRRYSLASMVGVYQTDDDAEAAQGRAATRSNDTKKSNAYAKTIIAAVEQDKDERLLEIWDECAQDHDIAAATWSQLPTPVKNKIKDLREPKKNPGAPVVPTRLQNATPPPAGDTF
jgi:hypothetical protein